MNINQTSIATKATNSNTNNTLVDTFKLQMGVINTTNPSGSVTMPENSSSVNGINANSGGQMFLSINNQLVPIQSMSSNTITTTTNTTTNAINNGNAYKSSPILLSNGQLLTGSILNETQLPQQQNYFLVTSNATSDANSSNTVRNVMIFLLKILGFFRVDCF